MAFFAPLRQQCRARRTPRHGLTLVEFLVVASVIAVLIAILLPALSMVREASRRAACMNAVRNLAKAFQAHDAARGQIPGWRNVLDPYTSASTRPPADPRAKEAACVSWTVPLLPHLGQTEIADWYASYRLDRTATDDARTKLVAPFVCPSVAGDLESPAPLCYFVNGGNGASVLSGSSSATRRQYAGDGVCGDAAGNLPSQPWYVTAGGADAYEPLRVSLSAITEGDGTTTTLLLAERTGTAAPRDVSWADNPLPSPHAPEADARKSTHAVLQSMAPPNLTSGSTSTSWMQGRDDAGIRFPSSRHGGGFIAAFCDSHVSFISDAIDAWVYAQVLSSDARPGRLSERVRQLQRKPGADGTPADYVFDEHDLRKRGR
jgi:prepilin-type N-terminal cleavage/methylation domain-containing protein/prepilin-type processing-associated H-X9-DG protein